jgi:hypothetical protein
MPEDLPVKLATCRKVHERIRKMQKNENVNVRLKAA